MKKINHKTYLFVPVVLVLLFIASMFLIPSNSDFQITKEQTQSILTLLTLVIVVISGILIGKKQYKNFAYLIAGIILSIIVYCLLFISIFGFIMAG